MNDPRVSVDGQPVPVARVGVNQGLNFGRFDAPGITTHDYECRLPSRLVLAHLAPGYARLVSELEADDVHEPSRLGEIGYPELREVLLRHPAQFEEVLQHLGRELLAAVLPGTAGGGWVVNSIDGYDQSAEQLRIRGRCFRYRRDRSAARG